MSVGACLRYERPHLREESEPKNRVVDGLLGMIVKPDHQAVAALCQSAWRAARGQILYSCVPNLTAALSTFRIRQRGFRRRAVCEARHVGLDNLLGRSVHANFAAVEPD